jgi:ATP-dependent RNA helicase RhlE
MLEFNELPLIPGLLKNLKALGYTSPTAIQAEAIPLLLEGHDLLGIAQTGTGKTAAFCLPIINKLITDPQNNVVRVLVLAPTRELAVQIQTSFEKYGKDLGIRSIGWCQPASSSEGD